MSETTAEPANNRSRWIALAVAAVLVLLVALLATRPAADEVTAARPVVGEQAPPIEGKALDGRTVSLDQLRGRYVVVNFFATWCIPCRNEHPQLVEFARRHPSATAPTIVAVAYDRNDIASTRSFFARNGGDWPVVGEDGSRIAINYGVRGLPESFVIGPDGRVVAQVTGEVTADDLDRLTGQIS